MIQFSGSGNVEGPSDLQPKRLRRKNITLDNFRFVLDHRVQQLMEERGPITRHIEGLEAHID